MLLIVFINNPLNNFFITIATKYYCTNANTQSLVICYKNYMYNIINNLNPIIRFYYRGNSSVANLNAISVKTIFTFAFRPISKLASFRIWYASPILSGVTNT